MEMAQDDVRQCESKSATIGVAEAQLATLVGTSQLDLQPPLLWAEIARRRKPSQLVPMKVPVPFIRNCRRDSSLHLLGRELFQQLRDQRRVSNEHGYLQINPRFGFSAATS